MAHKINYKAIKKKISKFIKTESYNDKNILETINDAVNRTNKIVFKTHLFFSSLWFLLLQQIMGVVSLCFHNKL